MNEAGNGTEHETTGAPSRRRVVAALTAAVAAVGTGALSTPTAAAASRGPLVPDLTRDLPDVDAALGPLDSTATLEAFADTIVPGEKRHSHDHAVAGAAEGPGAVQAGAVELLRLPELGLGPLMPALATLLHTEATAYALSRGKILPPTRPAFVALDFDDRTRLTAKLLGPDAVDQQVWVLLALFASVAFDTAAHLHTTTALAQRHPGLAWLRFPAPDADGLWRFPTYSYGRRLAREHPHTTAGGHPA